MNGGHIVLCLQFNYKNPNKYNANTDTCISVNRIMKL